MSAAANPPPGTFVSGTKVHVGSHRVTIEKYLSEGGFAHVYVVRVPSPDNKSSVAVLKRVAVPDKDALANMRTEVETMKRLQGHKHIVRYIDSHASQLKGGGYEVFLLMEYCAGGGLIDFMNTRLQHRLTEPEILNIFSDVSEGVATMHYLKPPLLHRDLKVENILISVSPTTQAVTYKLCDFGSAAPPRAPAANATEGRLIEEDIQRHTTMQYRSPEMVDVWRRQPIDEKSDIWALGVLLYKLCYYTTPFEDVGHMAILNASFKYPHYPPFSDRIKALIGWMLKEDPRQRPNIYQVVSEVCSMRSLPVPIKNIYSDRAPSEARQTHNLPSSSSSSPLSSPPPPAAGISRAAPVENKPYIPDVAPMRRGRPTAPSQLPVAATSAALPATADPFAALDSKDFNVRAKAVDNLAARFPSIDDFSITLDKGAAFQFPSAQPAQPARQTDPKLSDRVTNALADEVFAVPKADQQKSPFPERTVPAKNQAVVVGARSASKPQPPVQDPAPARPGYTSTGTMTSPPPTTVPLKSPPSKANPSPTQLNMPDLTKRPIWRVPDHTRSSSQPRASPAAQAAADALQPSKPLAQRPAFLDTHRSKSQTATTALGSPVSSRPSLEGHRASSQLYTGESVTRAKSANSQRPRPVSAAYIESNLDYLKTQERESAEKKRSSVDIRRSSRSTQGIDISPDEANIASDRDFLRSMEAEKSNREATSTHKKRASLPSLMGKLKRFERTKSSDGRMDGAQQAQQALRTPSPQLSEQAEKPFLSPISDSEAAGTPSRRFEDTAASGMETEDLPPEMRRELERRRLSAEEMRVARAAEEYRNRMAGGAPPQPSRANAIQQRVQAFLDEGKQPPKPKRTAEGYGRYTEASQAESQTPPASNNPVRKGPPPTVARKPSAPTHLVPAPQADGGLSYDKSRQGQQTVKQTNVGSGPATALRSGSRPSAPPKPRTLQAAVAAPGSAPARPSSSSSSSSSSFSQPNPQLYQGTGRGPSLAALLERDNQGVAAPGASSVGGNGGSELAAAEDVYRGQAEDWEVDFSKRFPSLSGIEMVETEISPASNANEGMPQRRAMRIKDI